MPMLVVAGALTEEIAGLRKRMAVDSVHKSGTAILYQGAIGGRKIVLARTGMGKAAVENACAAVSARHKISTLINIGYAGGLVPGLPVGHIVLGETVCLCRDAANMPSLQPSPAYTLDKALVSTAAGLPGNWCIRQGGMVTAHSLVADCQAKRTMGQVFGALSVDMESYWVARWASENQVRSLFVRVISDTASDRLPDFGKFTNPDGGVRPLSALLYFLLRPHQITQLARMYRGTRLAAANLADYGLQLIQVL